MRMLSDYWLFSTVGLIYSPISTQHTCWSRRLTCSLSPVLQLLYQSAGRKCQIPADTECVVEAERDRKEELKKKQKWKTSIFLWPQNRYFCLLDTYSLYYPLNRSLGGNIYWQCNFQTETRQIGCQKNMCRLSHHIRVSCNDFLCCLNFLTYAEQFPAGLISLSALNISVRCVWLSECFFCIVPESSLHSSRIWLRIFRKAVGRCPERYL